MNISYIPLSVIRSIWYILPSQLLNSPTTLTRNALGAHVLKSTPEMPSFSHTLLPRRLYALYSVPAANLLNITSDLSNLPNEYGSRSLVICPFLSSILRTYLTFFLIGINAAKNPASSTFSSCMALFLSLTDALTDTASGLNTCIRYPSFTRWPPNILQG